MFTLITSFFAGGFLKGLVELGVHVAKSLWDLVVWFVKTFAQGVGVVFHNLSVLTVILVAILAGGYYFKTWDNDKVLRECLQNPPTTVSQQAKYIHPIKKKFKSTKLIQAPKVTTKEGRTFNPFEGN